MRLTPRTYSSQAADPSSFGGATPAGLDDHPGWEIVEAWPPERSAVERAPSRRTDAVIVVCIGLVLAAIAAGSVLPSAGAVAPRNGSVESSAVLPARGSSTPDPSSPPTARSSGSIGTPRTGDRVGPGLVAVLATVVGPERPFSVEVAVGSAVIGRISARSSAGGTLSATVPVAGPKADVPAEIRITRRGYHGQSIIVATAAVILVAARGAEIWDATLANDGRSIMVVGCASLVPGGVDVVARSGGRTIDRVSAMVGTLGGAWRGSPFGVGTWAATVEIGAFAAGRGGRSLILEAVWKASSAGLGGTVAQVVGIGDDRKP